ncbi:MAG: transporter substrate-binding domain-containing protein [Nitrospiraceae bacterium]|nr:MAG: transporter substrate-binding domain-containing protein [Nitrospiraceae bacterium]
MPPLNMTTRDGEVIGLEPDMAQAIANAMGVKLTLETMPFSELLPSLEGSTSQLFVETVLFNTTLVPVRNYDEGIGMVIRDEVHALVADYPICVISVVRYPGKGLLSLNTPLTYEPLGIALPANDPHLINWMENFLKSLEGSGALDELKKRWFENFSWLNTLP